MRLRRYRRIASIMLVAQLTGCLSWQPVTASPLQMRSGDVPDHMRVTVADGGRVEVRNGRIENDTLVATLRCRPGQCAGAMARSITVAVSLSDIQELETRRVSAGSTGLMLGIFMGLGFLFAASVGQGISPFGG